MPRFRVYAGERYGQVDAEDVITLDSDGPQGYGLSDWDIVQSAVDWSADEWPESDAPYDACVWVETMDGREIGREDMTIDEQGEIDPEAGTSRGPG